jgi:hypothetical protein
MTGEPIQSRRHVVLEAIVQNCRDDHADDEQDQKADEIIPIMRSSQPVYGTRKRETIAILADTLNTIASLCTTAPRRTTGWLKSFSRFFF